MSPELLATFRDKEDNIALITEPCVYCGKQHFHGSGQRPAPWGDRSPHCYLPGIKGLLQGYTLVSALSAGELTVRNKVQECRRECGPQPRRQGIVATITTLDCGRQVLGFFRKTADARTYQSLLETKFAVSRQQMLLRPHTHTSYEEVQL